MHNGSVCTLAVAGPRSAVGLVHASKIYKSMTAGNMTNHITRRRACMAPPTQQEVVQHPTVTPRVHRQWVIIQQSPWTGDLLQFLTDSSIVSCKLHAPVASQHEAGCHSLPVPSGAVITVSLTPTCGLSYMQATDIHRLNARGPNSGIIATQQ